MHAISKPDTHQPELDTEPGAADEEAVPSAALYAQRAVAELRSGREVELHAGSSRLVVTALELTDTGAVDRACDAGAGLQLLLTPERASVLGYVTESPAVQARLAADSSALSTANAPIQIARRIAGLDEPEAMVKDRCVLDDRTDSVACAALELVRHARLQPALLVSPASAIEHATGVDDAPRVRVQADAVLGYRAARGRWLMRAGAATVPLESAGDTTFIAYRERFGEAEHAAVIIGSPDFSSAVTVRLHSSCFTGDLFGSLRCDCGEQLNGAVKRLAADGGGVVLYLAQEGRGIGLGNKLRAYRLQAEGLDTIDADRRLGFAADGRDFSAARSMLEDLGIKQIRLLTNNPAKVAALDRDGLDVVEQLPLSGTVNPHNHRYLETKRDRAGHLASVTAGRHRDPALGGSTVP